MTSGKRTVVLPDILKSALNGEEDKVRSMLAADSSLTNVRGGGNSTPLHGAAFKGHVGVVKQLLEAGADVDARTNNFETPAHWAAAMGRREALELLIQYGADLSAKDTVIQQTPLDKARKNNHTEVIGLLENDTVIDALREKGKESKTVKNGRNGGLAEIEELKAVTFNTILMKMRAGICCQR